jgi:hypothetical protein
VGTLESFDGEAGRWAVKLESGNEIRVRVANLEFIRAPKDRPLPGKNECRETLEKLSALYKTQDWNGILQMEGKALLTARALVLPASGRQERAEAVYYYLGIAHQRLALLEQLGGADVRESAHAKKALEVYLQQLEVAQRFAGRPEEAKVGNTVRRRTRRR